MELNAGYRDERYSDGNTGWEMQQVSPPLQAYFAQLRDKTCSILIPGCGNACPGNMTSSSNRPSSARRTHPCAAAMSPNCTFSKLHIQPRKIPKGTYAAARSAHLPSSPSFGRGSVDIAAAPLQNFAPCHRQGASFVAAAPLRLLTQANRGPCLLRSFGADAPAELRDRRPGGQAGSC
jgi:hypothetical protein